MVPLSTSGSRLKSGSWQYRCFLPRLYRKVAYLTMQMPTAPVISRVVYSNSFKTWWGNHFSFRNTRWGVALLIVPHFQFHICFSGLPSFVGQWRLGFYKLSKASDSYSTDSYRITDVKILPLPRVSSHDSTFHLSWLWLPLSHLGSLNRREPKISIEISGFPLITQFRGCKTPS